MSALFDPVRERYVTATPEERIRQSWLQWMIHQGGYPRALIAVEKELASLPYLSGRERSQLPGRRVDIIAFGQQPLHALLVVECKALPLESPEQLSTLAQQVIGYNRFIQAPYLALVNESCAFTGYYDAAQEGYQWVPGFPSYRSLLR